MNSYGIPLGNRSTDSKWEGCLHRFTREGYYGGRVEVFTEYYGPPKHKCIDEDIEFIQDRLNGLVKTCKICEDWYKIHPPLNYGDINSMYPWAMLGKMPGELAYVQDKPNIPPLETNGLNIFLGFLECTVEIPKDCYLPPLPLRQDGKLIFPVGTFSGVWTSEELALLRLVGGRILSHKRSAWFRGRDIFGAYVRHWYKFRDKTAPGYSVALDFVAKLFLNSLYGKMGMNLVREKLWFFPTDEEYKEHKLIPLHETIFGVFKEVTESSPSYVIPHIAAWVTARSRVRLWTLMHNMLMAGYKLYYCDTDSIVTNAPIQDSTKLGDLKTVCQIKRARFVAPKMYFIEQVDGKNFIKAKGFNGGFGSKSLSEEDFNTIVDLHQKVKLRRMRKVKEGLRTGKRSPSMMITEKGVKKGLLNEKRIVLPNGDTKPLEINGDINGDFSVLPF